MRTGSANACRKEANIDAISVDGELKEHGGKCFKKCIVVQSCQNDKSRAKENRRICPRSVTTRKQHLNNKNFIKSKIRRFEALPTRGVPMFVSHTARVESCICCCTFCLCHELLKNKFWDRRSGEPLSHDGKAVEDKPIRGLTFVTFPFVYFRFAFCFDGWMIEFDQWLPLCF